MKIICVNIHKDQGYGEKMPISRTNKEEIQELKSATSQTSRTNSPELEEVLYDAFPVLDHGFIRVVDYMGTDASIVQAARVSYGKGTKRKSEDKGLINYLLRHHHTTPFEMCEIKLHVKLPLFVARQWIRHRTASVNEYSARYSILENEFYIPEPEKLASQSLTNKQGRAETLEGEEAEETLNQFSMISEQSYEVYRGLLNEDERGNILDSNRKGLARELSRCLLPTNFYTQWYWKINLHNLLHFLSLRADSHAQYEIRAYAEIILNEILKRWVPMTYDAYMKYRVGGKSFSSEAMKVIKDLIQGKKVQQDSYDMGAREWRELMADLGRDE